MSMFAGSCTSSRERQKREAETVSWKTMLERIWSNQAARGEGQSASESAVDMAAASADGAQRKTVALPSILGSVRPRNALLPKGTPANLRRFAESPVARRAINVIKDRIAGMDWQVQLRRGYKLADVPDAHVRMEILRRTLEEPNNSDSFRSVVEQALEDALVGGFGAIEMERTDDPERPFSLWPVDGATIQLNANWNGDQSSPRYAQNANGVGSGSKVPLYDNELIYLRLNPRSHTPFGLGALEVAFESVNSFLSARQRYFAE
jgi:Phage portal protein